MGLEKIVGNSPRMRKWAQHTLRGVLTAAMLSVGCNNGGSSEHLVNPPPEPPSQLPIPTQSALIHASSGGSINSNGYEVVIPPGALSRDATVTIQSASPSDVLDLSANGGQRASLPLEVRLGTSLQHSINVRFPLSSLNDGLAGIAKGSDGWYHLQRLFLNQGKLTMAYGGQDSLRINREGSAMENNFSTWILNFPATSTQRVVLNQRSADLTSSERVALLIHGFGSSPSGFNGNLLPLLNDLYHNRVMTFQYPSGLPIANNISSLESTINALGTLPFKFDIVAHSMGGLVGRGFVRRNPDKVDKFVSLGTPHEGIESSLLLTNYLEVAIQYHLTGKLFSPFSSGADDALFGSNFLRDLNSSGDVHSHYLLISGEHPDLLSPIISGDDDGLVSVESAELGNLPSSLGKSVKEIFALTHFA